MYGDDEPGDQVTTYHTLAPRIIEESYRNQLSSAEYVGILENTPRNIVDPTPTSSLDPLKVGAGIAGAAAIGTGLYFGYNAYKHRKSPEQSVKEQIQQNSFGNDMIVDPRTGARIIKKTQ